MPLSLIYEINLLKQSLILVSNKLSKYKGQFSVCDHELTVINQKFKPRPVQSRNHFNRKLRNETEQEKVSRQDTSFVLKN